MLLSYGCDYFVDIAPSSVYSIKVPFQKVTDVREILGCINRRNTTTNSHSRIHAYCLEMLFIPLEFDIYVGHVVQNQPPVSEVT